MGGPGRKNSKGRRNHRKKRGKKLVSANQQSTFRSGRKAKTLKGLEDALKKNKWN